MTILEERVPKIYLKDSTKKNLKSFKNSTGYVKFADKKTIMYTIGTIIVIN